MSTKGEGSRLGDASPLRFVQYGCGPIGCRILAYALERTGLECVGAVDTDPEKAGRDLGAVAGLDRELGIDVSGDPEELLSQARPDVVLLATGSHLPAIYDQLAGIVACGANVVSTCEELSYPYRRYPELSARLDELARECGVTVLGTGINPGFLMDAWPLFMTAPCTDVTEIQASRVQDASTRRLPFQQKIGAGLTPEEFQERVDEGTFGHVGLPESAAMIAAGIGWQLDRIDEHIEPVMAQGEPKAAGLRQTAVGFDSAGRRRVQLRFEAYIGAPESFDAVRIIGTPELTVRIEGGTHGDVGTAAIVLNSMARVAEAAPGLVTMKDLPLVACWGG